MKNKNGLFYRVTRKVVLKLKEKSPEILMGIGVTAFVGSTILACRATLKSGDVSAKFNERKQMIEDAKIIAAEHPEDVELVYTEKDAKKDAIISHAMRIRDYTKLYGPSTALAIFGLVCICKGRNILRDRNFAMISAYNLIAKGFDLYRGRVAKELGEDMDHHFRYGTELVEEIVTETDSEGKKIKKKVLKHDYSGSKIDGSIYTRVFDSKLNNWSNNDEYNWTFLRAKQDYYNFVLMRDGVVFLNDVYEGLGFTKTQAGQEVGWALNGDGDGIINFNLKYLYNSGTEIANPILVEFNVDGNVRHHLQVKI